jgi:hypothetical protein
MRVNEAGDITITVKKDDLLGRLKDNRSSHRDLYEQAFDGYCKLMREELEERLSRIGARRAIDPYLRHQAPEDHTGDYDDVIEMLCMAIGNEVELTQTQFRCYVKDDWGWKRQWTASTAAYIGKP